MDTFLQAFGFGLMVIGFFCGVLIIIQRKTSLKEERDMLTRTFSLLLFRMEKSGRVDFDDYPAFNFIDFISLRSLKSYIYLLEHLDSQYDNFLTDRQELNSIMDNIEVLNSETKRKEVNVSSASVFKLGSSLSKIIIKLGEPNRRQVRLNKTIVFYGQNRFDFNEENKLIAYDVRTEKSNRLK